MKIRLQQFIRALDPHEFDRPLDPMTIDDWVKRVDLEIHENFREILNRMIASQGKSTSIPALIEREDKPPTRKPDSREVNSLSTLVLAMAIDQYGFDPKAARSTVPKEIVELLASLGLELSQETVLKYLRIGSHELPKDWKPVP